MQQNTAQIEERVRELEFELLTPAVRQSSERLSNLIADEFREFGSSGRIFNKNEVIQALRTEPPAQSSIHDFHAKILSDGFALVTYRAAKRENADAREACSLRSSVWANRDGRWQVLFHQGTKVPED